MNVFSASDLGDQIQRTVKGICGALRCPQVVTTSYNTSWCRLRGWATLRGHAGQDFACSPRCGLDRLSASREFLSPGRYEDSFGSAVPQSTGVWRNGSASDSKSEAWEFEALCPHVCSSSAVSDTMQPPPPPPPLPSPATLPQSGLGAKTRTPTMVLEPRTTRQRACSTKGGGAS